MLSRLVTVWPEAKPHVKLSHRSLLAWKRPSFVTEGSPVPEELVWPIGSFPPGERWLGEAVIYFPASDCDLRSEDRGEQFFEDRFYSQGSIGLAFGVSDRGASSRTGANQGVIVCRAFVTGLRCGALARRQAGQKLFNTTQAGFRRKWHRALETLGLQFLGPPHSLRHARPRRTSRGEGEPWNPCEAADGGAPCRPLGGAQRVTSPSPTGAGQGRRRCLVVQRCRLLGDPPRSRRSRPR